ncbi:MAG: hypothetical protein WCR07_14955 [Verrucomicrobiota bacterium]|jgi:hypothetical protein
MNTNELPPRDLWEVARRLKHDEPLDAGDPRWVDTSPGRDLGHDRLYRSLGVDSRTWTLRMDRTRHCSLLSGHRGTGKSTELRRIAAQLHGPDLFHVVFLDILREPMGGGRFRSHDVCLALCRRLLTEMEQEGVPLDGDGTRLLETWLRTQPSQPTVPGLPDSLESRPASHGNGHGNGNGVVQGMGEASVAKLLDAWIAWGRSGLAGREAVATSFHEGFDGFSDAFNHLVAMARRRLKEEGLGRDLLFVLDGTDRLDGDDGLAFFGGESHPLRRLDGIFVHCAPVQPIRPPGGVQPLFDRIVRLAPLTLHEKFDPGSPSLPVRVRGSQEHHRRIPSRPRFELGPVPIPAAYDVMRQMILMRAPARFFDPDPVETGDWSLLDRLVGASGGHPRDLMRLLDHAFGHAGGDCFDADSVTQAIRSLAGEYRRILEPDDYRMLAEIDRGGPRCRPQCDATRRLLGNLALLEYDGDWWQSHPLVRSLPDYRNALEKVPAAP